MASLPEQYLRQEKWRHWDEVLAQLPPSPGQTVFDFGCGVGAVTARLSQLGARAVGIDIDEDLLASARQRHQDIQFIHADLNSPDPRLIGVADGIWSSFVAAYFPDLGSALGRWKNCLKPGGWLALVEVDDLLGHGPLAKSYRADISRLYQQALQKNRYDFRSGSKLEAAARDAGLEVLQVRSLPDDELCHSGPVTAEVLQAWRDRLQRMGGLKELLAGRFEAFEAAFLASLSSPEHRTTARVNLVLARQPGA
jgi:SAM-dependent methyltransferase